MSYEIFDLLGGIGYTVEAQLLKKTPGKDYKSEPSAVDVELPADSEFHTASMTSMIER